MKLERRDDVNTNAIADEVLAYLETKHTRCYRNGPSKKVPFPYVVFRIDSGTDTYPSDDLYLNIDIFEKADKSVREIEDLADLIDGDGLMNDAEGNIKEPSGLNHKVINSDKSNLQFEREQRQYVKPEELVSTHLINLRYVIRAYYK
jgi:hypothetical protein